MSLDAANWEFAPRFGRWRGGGYNSASEVVREALRLMQERDEILELRKKEIAKQIAEGYESLSRGEGIPAETAFRELDRRHEKSRRRRKRE